MMMLMNAGELEGKRILGAASVDALFSRQWRHAAGNGDSSYGGGKGVFNAWGLGNQHFLDLSGPAFGDRLVEGGGFTAVGYVPVGRGMTGCGGAFVGRRIALAAFGIGTPCGPPPGRGCATGTGGEVKSA